MNQKDEVRKRLGYLPQEFGVYPKVSAEVLLDHFALLKGVAEDQVAVAPGVLRRSWARGGRRYFHYSSDVPIAGQLMLADSAGVETELAMDEWVPIGVFVLGEPRDELSAPLYLRMHRIRSGEQTITVTVPREPDLAGIDPHHLLDWVEDGDDDNIEVVTIDSGLASATSNGVTSERALSDVATSKVGGK